ncbi:MAG: NADH-quinone oxidoreductase subunit J [Bacteroidetes bacterium]|nr:MAG: NADH-quinone oxidoreductase subunit J [Bacteroidota bacterium]
MNLYEIVFYFFAALTVGSAAVVVFSRNIVYAAFSLLFTFFGVAGLYVLLNADFLAVTQLMVYVGGILVLLLFGVMLTNTTLSVAIRSGSLHVLPASLLAAALAGMLGGLYWTAEWSVSVRASDIAAETTSKEIGSAFITSHLLPFEVASVVLLVAIVGAAMMARRERTTEQ